MDPISAVIIGGVIGYIFNKFGVNKQPEQPEPEQPEPEDV